MMYLYCRRALSLVLIFATLITFSVPADLIALDDHLVSTMDLQQSVIAASQARQEQILKIKQFFQSEVGGQILKQAGVTSTKLENALPHLSNEELAQLSLKTDAVQTNFAAGYHGHDMVTMLIIILLVVAIVVIVAAAAD